ncbi:MAG TPA: dihydrodipicolinate synthase family protein [Thermohalobaculum sp.]|nr:dihydrodipicolinate synthase family protein [Thermohalobaculum sp.]
MADLPRGLIAPNLTPYGDDLTVATDLYIAHAERLLGEGCAGLAPFGTTGEALSVGLDERIDALGALISAGVPAGRLVPGTGLTNLPDTIRLSRACLELGCAGVMVLPPFYYKSVSDDGLHAYFEALVAALGPEATICLYHIPAVAGVGLPLPLVARLARDFPQIAAIKDSSGEEHNLAELLGIPGLAVYPGSELMAPQGIAGGAAGCISASANVNAPMLAEFVQRLADAPAEGFADPELETRVRAVRLALQAAGPIPAQKRLLALGSGDARWANVRPPLVAMPEAAGRELAAELAPYLALDLAA